MISIKNTIIIISSTLHVYGIQIIPSIIHMYINVLVVHVDTVRVGRFIFETANIRDIFLVKRVQLIPYTSCYDNKLIIGSGRGLETPQTRYNATVAVV